MCHVIKAFSVVPQSDEERLAMSKEAAAAELEDADLQDDDEEGWSAILKKMSIAPSTDTLEADERAARKLAKKKKRALRPKRDPPAAAGAAAAAAAGAGAAADP